jgi:hypothetical protein
VAKHPLRKDNTEQNGSKASTRDDTQQSIRQRSRHAAKYPHAGAGHHALSSKASAEVGDQGNIGSKVFAGAATMAKHLSRERKQPSICCEEPNDCSDITHQSWID